MNVRASLRFLRLSPRKVRLVADLIRGMPVAAAERQLQLNPQGASRPILKLLRSAIANATKNFSLERDGLTIWRITVDQGPTLKRYRPAAFGTAHPVRKRSSHITVILASPDKPAKKPSKDAVKELKPKDQAATAKSEPAKKPTAAPAHAALTNKKV